MRSWLPLVAALAGATGSARAQDSSLARLIHRTRLENGLDVITVENEAVPLATVLVAVRNGAFTQDSADQGMAHLYEHLLFRSFGNGPDAFAIEVTRLNGAYNGATSQEVGGDRASLAGMTLDRLKQTYARYYLPNNAALIVTGDVSSERVFAQAAEAFRDWRPGPDPFVDHPIPPIAPRAASTVVIVAHDVRDVTIRLALQGPRG